MTNDIRIGVSACLVGQETRYDGGHAYDPFVGGVLAERFELVPVCPEDELGMGTPRETVDLWGDAAAPLMLGTNSRRDWTERMNTWSAARCTDLAELDLCGYVFKKDSPSCGLWRVKLHREGTEPVRRARGLFATEFARRFPEVPLVDETGLQDARSLASFLEQVLACHRRRGGV